MIRRDFLKTGTLSALGISLLSATETFGQLFAPDERAVGSAKNIIFLVSDGMSNGTLTMANLLSQRMYGRESKWISLYRENKVVRAFMDTASADSMVTDSAASSSAWGGGVRVNNGSLNVNADGSFNTPILQKFKSAGKKVGCVTTVPITHATPAGFCICNKSRSDQNGIALQYLPLRFDVMMGGGDKYFNPSKRKDKVDVYSQFEKADYQLAKTKQQMQALDHQKPVLAVFDNDALPFSVDYAHDQKLQNTIPTLSEMTVKAIDLMKDHAEGFVLQVEGGKVDWAAHSNDTPGLLFDQLEFDLAVEKAIEFAEKDRNTLVIITTDHGNGNPGLFGEENADQKFDLFQKFKHSNDWVLNSIKPNDTAANLIAMINDAQGYTITNEQAKDILTHYQKLDGGGLYNVRKLPFERFGKIQSEYTSVNWGSMEHSADYVELAAFGPGSTLMNPFVRNTELHNLMLNAAGVKV
ncbi:alkaline phosphatase [Pedobacter chitinilyticus]|uniref:Alkaline phosphatase n=1 Tax=Pedobacter chitinilyticus TaxID=2233776 RepID=A0A443YJR9_9SPHI|nr:alkaline phosphatase [Pedobacter chitinilyticus]RWU03972.1 alkaline phosphatase [Pedobacter chitinilyticus]